MADWHWRNSMKKARFFELDARAAAPLLLVLVHFRGWTLVLAALIIGMFWYLERKGVSFEQAIKRARVFLIGHRRPGVIWTAKRKTTDYG